MGYVQPSMGRQNLTGCAYSLARDASARSGRDQFAVLHDLHEHGFERYKTALGIDGLPRRLSDAEEPEYAHEAGYDAFLTVRIRTSCPIRVVPAATCLLTLFRSTRRASSSRSLPR
jgi:hypothetical protein